MYKRQGGSGPGTAERQAWPTVAQAPFLTVRTVEMHLSNAYRTLKLGSRTQLARALG